MAEHSDFGGSVAPRYMNCTGSVALCRIAPQQSPSKFAQDGNNAHAFMERLLKDGERTAQHFVGLRSLENTQSEDKGVLVTQELADCAQVYLDAVWAECDKDTAYELYIEERFAFRTPSADEGEVYGRNDALVYLPSQKRLVVFDYKHGQGVSVSADENNQLRFYAAGAALAHEDWPLDEIELVIVQPRANDADYNGAVRRCTFDPVALLDFAGELDAKIAEAKKPNASLTVGPWCEKTFCPARAICPALQDEGLKLTKLTFANVTTVRQELLPAPYTIRPADFADIEKGLAILAAWGAAIQEYKYNELRQGRPIAGYKLVEKIGRRKWADNEEEIAAYLSLVCDLSEDDVCPRKLVTITEAERLLKVQGLGKEAKDELALRYTTKESSGLVMVPESDKRPAVDAAATDFASVDLYSIGE